MRIMLVDDSRTMRNVQKSILSQIGYKDVVEAENGLDALTRCNAEAPDLILLDWNMPQMDGLSFLTEFRKKNKDVPVIMVTTEAERVRVIEAIKAGVNNYVVKPFTPDLLEQRINETLSKMQAA
jgi:two-component system chemotaxis response regulator CheY